MDRSILSRDSATSGRPPEVSPTAFGAQPPNLHPAPLMDVDFAVLCQFVRRRMPPIRFLSIGSHLCSTLLSDPASRRRPCASLSLHLHQVVKRTFTSQLSNMLGTQRRALRALGKPCGFPTFPQPRRGRMINLNRTDHVPQKPDILICKRHIVGAASAARVRNLGNLGQVGWTVRGGVCYSAPP